MVHRKSEYRLNFKWFPPGLCREVRSSAADYRLLRRRTDLAHDGTWVVWNEGLVQGSCDCDREKEEEEERTLPVPRNRQKHNDLVQLYQRRTSQPQTSPDSLPLPPPSSYRVRVKEAQVQTEPENDRVPPQSTHEQELRSFQGDGHEMERIDPRTTKLTDSNVGDGFVWPARSRTDVRRRKLDVTPAIVNDVTSYGQKRSQSSSMKKKNRIGDGRETGHPPALHSSRSTRPKADAPMWTAPEKAHSSKTVLLGPLKSVVAAKDGDKFSGGAKSVSYVAAPLNHSSIWMTEYRRNFARESTNG